MSRFREFRSILADLCVLAAFFLAMLLCFWAVTALWDALK